MDSRRRGEELNQLSRLLFDAAATKWYWATGLEVAAGAVGLAFGVADVTGDLAIAGVAAGVLLLAAAYYLRLRFEDQYDTAETMRRQSVLTEGLDWPVNEIQFSEWRRKAGSRILDRFVVQPRDDDYYTTMAGFGPTKLLEMTAESAFYTRHLYGKVQPWLWGMFAGSLIMLAVVITLPALQITSASTDNQLASAVYLALPIVLALDLLGWALRLRRLQEAICEIEKDLEQLEQLRAADEPQVMRLVAEYNCQVVAGFPISSWLFNRSHREIRRLWDMHQHRCTGGSSI